MIGTMGHIRVITKPQTLQSVVALLALLAVASGCAPAITPTPVDVVGSVAAQLASSMLTQTVAAYTPTQPPASSTPVPTETVTPEPTEKPTGNTITVINHAPCYFGPGPSYKLESYISASKEVELLGVGSISGWYIIRNPYFYAPCWVAASDVQIEPGMDTSVFPIMTPGH